MVIHSSFADFVLFLYVHMSHVDNDYDPTEMKVIKEKMTRIFHKDVDLEKKLYTTIREYNAFDQTKMNELIKDTFAHFAGVKFSQKYKVYTDMYDIINADGKIDESETKAMEVLRQIIQIGTEAKAQ
jgi:uncharacterized tellurite resistance protein B-like protein